MRIAHIAPLWLPIPPKDYGGLETILAYLIDAQVKQGHEVTLFACAGSQTAGKVVEVIEKPTARCPVGQLKLAWELLCWRAEKLVTTAVVLEVVGRPPLQSTSSTFA